MKNDGRVKLMDHEHTQTNGHAAAAPLPGPPIDFDQIAALGKKLFSGGGRMPEWVRWALVAGCVGGAVAVLLDKLPSSEPFGLGLDPQPLMPTPPRTVVRTRRDQREFPLGFFQSGIGVNIGAIDVVSRPQIHFLGERLLIPSNIAPFFSLIDIKVGNRSQLSNSTALPAQVFAENQVGVRLQLSPATVAQDIALVVENISMDKQTFMATLIGTEAQRCDVCGGNGRVPLSPPIGVTLESPFV